MGLIGSFRKKEVNEFKKDIVQIVRVAIGINKDFGKVDRKLDDYIRDYKKLVSIFNKKYGNVYLKIRTDIDNVSLSVFLKNEKNVRDVFINAATKVNGLKSIGSKHIGATDISNAEKFSYEVENIKDHAFISYYNPDAGATTLILEYNKKQKMVELHCDLKSLTDERSPEFELMAYYSLKDGFKEDIQLYPEAVKFGFIDLLNETEKKEWLDSFNPKFGE